MSLVEKLEGEVEIKSAADTVHHVFSRRPHHMSIMTPNNIHSCDLYEGEFGKQGSVLIWTFTHDGEKKGTKELVEEIDYVNNVTTYKLLEGDLLKYYKQMRTIVKASPKGEGSVVRWTLEYERMTLRTPHPNTFLDVFIECTKDVDAYLISHPKYN